MSREEMRDKIQGAIDYLNANPAEARYTDSPATARLANPAGLKVEVGGPNGERISTDMPTSVGGTNSAASPGWYLRAAEASCVATLIAMRAAHQGITLNDIEVTVDSESDDRGILGADADTVAGPLSARVAVRLEAVGATQQQLQELVNWAVVHCPVTDAVRRAIPMSVEFSLD
ncbi:MAG: OsmC family protein [Candidatus Limnocylindrales bacterium]